MSKKVIIFGPWVGEFSYELSWWNPECRKVKNDNFKDYYAVHLGFNGRKVMYSDFIDEYIPHPTELEETLQFPATYGEHINVPRPRCLETVERVLRTMIRSHSHSACR